MAAASPSTPPPLPLTRQDLVNLRRSLAMGSLPPREVAQLVDTCDALLVALDDSRQREADVRTELEALRPVVADLRARLSKLHARVGAPAGVHGGVRGGVPGGSAGAVPARGTLHT